MARWDQMTVARRQRAAEEMDRDVAAEEMDQEGSGEITEAPIQAKAAEVARITPTWQGPVAETTTGICPAISGATPILSVLRAPGWVLMSL